MKPTDWPRFMEYRQLKAGVAYYWCPKIRNKPSAFPFENEALGSDYGQAVKKANALNKQLDSWRTGERSEIYEIGTVGWWFTEYEHTLYFRQLGDQHRKNVKQMLKNIANDPLTNPTGKLQKFGDLLLSSITAAAADKLYAKRHIGRARAALSEFSALKKAWEICLREHPEWFASINPFKGVVKAKRKTTPKVAASREEAYALAGALRDIGHPHLGAAALVCFEFHQRPLNVLAGSIAWSHYTPGELVRIEHWKTGEIVELELCDDDGSSLYPEIEEYLADLERLGPGVVLSPRKPHAPYRKETARDNVRRAREAAGLPEYVTLDACRHGGLTELGDAELTESEGMALSGHKTPESFRLYVKQTRRQRLNGARKRLKTRTKPVECSK